jgi:hypothetical protein
MEGQIVGNPLSMASAKHFAARDTEPLCALGRWMTKSAKSVEKFDMHHPVGRGENRKSLKIKRFFR